MLLKIKQFLKSRYFNFIFLLSLIVITIYKMAELINIKNLSEIARVTDLKYILLGFFCIIVSLFVEALIMNNIIYKIHKLKNFMLSFKVIVLNIYYNLITPFSSGGQVAQIYVLEKNQVKGSAASAIVVNRFILYHLSIITYCLLLSVFNYRLLLSYSYKVYGIVLISILINMLWFIALIMATYSPSKLLKIVNSFTYFLYKIKLIKSIEKKQEKIIDFIHEYNKHSNLILKDFKFLASNIILTFAQISLYFGSIYFIFKALGCSNLSFITVLSMQSFLYMFVALSPTPGNIGANEYGFYLFFKHLTDPNILGYALILYSIFIYYFNLIVCGLLTFIFYVRDKKNKKH